MTQPRLARFRTFPPGAGSDRPRAFEGGRAWRPFIGRILTRREVLQRFGVAVAAAANGSGYAASTFNIGLV